MIRYMLSAFLFFAFFFVKGQNIYHPNQLMVRGNISVIESSLKKNNLRFQSGQIDYRIKTLSSQLNVHLVTVKKDSELLLTKDYLEEIDGLEIYFDHFVFPRKIPNDERVGEQKSLELIRAYDAWEETTGDSDLGGRKPIIAVMDDGFDLSHEDLDANIFANPAEIPSNNIDDDGNGYIDDYLGINLTTGNDNHNGNSHGTSVAGIIGADSNNGIGISGIVWNANILLVGGVETESKIIEGAEYLTQLRRTYNQTEGKEGAYIVVANYSGGLDNAFANDHPLWCETYDMLGEVGILSVAASTNNNSNIDVTGDMPSTCLSEYLLISNTAGLDGEWVRSGYSEKHVDIGSPGLGTISISSNNNYIIFEGTSAAAPHVAGAAALLYTVKCPFFHQLTIDEPNIASSVVKYALIKGATPSLSQIDKSKAQGTLNIFQSMIEMTRFCVQDSAELDISSITYDNQDLLISYATDEIANYTLYLFNISGHLIISSNFNTSLFADRIVSFPVQNLPAGIYIVALEAEDQLIRKKIFIKGD